MKPAEKRGWIDLVNGGKHGVRTHEANPYRDLGGLHALAFCGWVPANLATEDATLVTCECCLFHMAELTALYLERAAVQR